MQLTYDDTIKHSGTWATTEYIEFYTVKAGPHIRSGGWKTGPIRQVDHMGLQLEVKIITNRKFHI